MSRLRKTWLPLITQPGWGGKAATVTYTIAGTVYDSDGTTAVASATVALGAYSATSAGDGTYTISAVPAGTSGSMTCTKAGYSWTAKTISAMSGNLTAQNYTNLWYVPGGVAPIIAYQPKGAASAATALVNLITPSTYDASNGVAYPSWNANTGWTFNAVSSQYLDIGGGTGPIFNGAVSYLARVNINYASANQPIFGHIGSSTACFNTRILVTTQLPVIRAGFTTIGTASTAVSSEKVIGATYTAAGAFIMYLNGASDGTGTNDQAITEDTDAIGGFNTSYLTGAILAIAAWNVVLTPAQVLAATTGMLAL